MVCPPWITERINEGTNHLLAALNSFSALKLFKPFGMGCQDIFLWPSIMKIIFVEGDKDLR